MITIDSDANGFAEIVQGIFDNRAILLLAGDDDIVDPSKSAANGCTFGNARYARCSSRM